MIYNIHSFMQGKLLHRSFFKRSFYSECHVPHSNGRIQIQGKAKHTRQIWYLLLCVSLESDVVQCQTKIISIPSLIIYKFHYSVTGPLQWRPFRHNPRGLETKKWFWNYKYGKSKILPLPYTHKFFSFL